jgi:hypothetical protein
MMKGTVEEKKAWVLPAELGMFLNSRMIPQLFRDCLKGGLCQYKN